MENRDKTAEPAIPIANPADAKPAAWTIPRLQSELGLGEGKSGRRQAERIVAKSGLLPAPLALDDLKKSVPGFRKRVAEAMIATTRRRKGRVVFLQESGGAAPLVFANDPRGGWQWYFRESNHKTKTAFLTDALAAIMADAKNPLLFFCTGGLLEGIRRINTGHLALAAYPEPVRVTPHRLDHVSKTFGHLDALEAESIAIMREIVAEASKPVMLYSIGKDSAVMLHLALKAFSPAPPPFPLLHVDTGWKFRAMYDFREMIADSVDMPLVIHKNPEGMERNINPFDHGAALHTEIMKTDALKQALDLGGYDAAFGGARRDEEKSRAKERIFSHRDRHHRWDAHNQRPELWSLYNARPGRDETMRVFPLSNWTEIDIWHYIRREGIAVVPLYFAAPRPVLHRDGGLIMVDDDRMAGIEPGEITISRVRFRSLGCYPLSCAEESDADSIDKIIAELLTATHSERAGRIIDRSANASMEDKKREGYF